MTIDEAIKKVEEVAEENEFLANQYSKKNQNHPVERWDSCEVCAAEHRQLASWLRELKQLRQAVKDIRREIAEYKDDKLIHAERNEMIDIVLDIIDRHLKEGKNE